MGPLNDWLRSGHQANQEGAGGAPADTAVAFHGLGLSVRLKGMVKEATTRSKALIPRGERVLTHLTVVILLVIRALDHAYEKALPDS